MSVNGKTIYSKLAAGKFPDFAAIVKEVKAKLYAARVLRARARLPRFRSDFKLQFVGRRGKLELELQVG